MIKFYGFSLSGHSHRVELMLNLLGLPFENITVDLVAGAQKKPEFLALNPFGSVPVMRMTALSSPIQTRSSPIWPKNMAARHGCRAMRSRRLKFKAGCQLQRAK